MKEDEYSGTAGNATDVPEFEGERYESKNTKRIAMVFDKKYIDDDNYILGIVNIGLGDLFALKKIDPEQYPGLICIIGNGTKEVLSFDDIEKRNAFFDKIKKELT